MITKSWPLCYVITVVVAIVDILSELGQQLSLSEGFEVCHICLLCNENLLFVITQIRNHPALHVKMIVTASSSTTDQGCRSGYMRCLVSSNRFLNIVNAIGL